MTVLSFIKSRAHTCTVFLRSDAAAVIRRRRLFRSELPIVWLLFEGGDYSRYCIYKACSRVPGPPSFYLHFALTIIHRSGTEVKNGEGWSHSSCE